jgi:hypothetical protein
MEKSIWWIREALYMSLKPSKLVYRARWNIVVCCLALMFAVVGCKTVAPSSEAQTTISAPEACAHSGGAADRSRAICTEDEDPFTDYNTARARRPGPGPDPCRAPGY